MMWCGVAYCVGRLLVVRRGNYGGCLLEEERQLSGADSEQIENETAPQQVIDHKGCTCLRASDASLCRPSPLET